MTDPILARKLQELINRYGHDAVANAFPPKKVLNEVDRVNDGYKFNNNQNNNRNDGVAATPIITKKPPSDAAPSIASKDSVNNEKVKKYRAMEDMISV